MTSSPGSLARLGLVIALLVLAYLQARLWLLPGNLRDVRADTERLQAMQERNAAAAQRNADQESWVRLLEEDMDSIELQAREDLDLVQPDESLYLVPR